MQCSLIEDIVECYVKSHLDNPYSTFKAPPKDMAERFWFYWLPPEIAQQLQLPEDTEDVTSVSVEGKSNLQQLIDHEGTVAVLIYACQPILSTCLCKSCFRSKQSLNFSKAVTSQRSLCLSMPHRTQ